MENTAGRPDLREQIEIAIDAPPAPPDALPPYLRLQGHNQWPDEALPELRPCVEEYAEHMGRLSNDLTDALGMALGLQPRCSASSSSRRLTGSSSWQATSAPPRGITVVGGGGETAAAPVDVEPQVGVGAHTDSGFLTLLLQDDAGGLQAFTRGAWRDVPPAGNGVIVCNLGEVAEMLSGGYLLATPHRVLLPQSTRLSIPYFHNPILDARVRPLELPDDLPWERDAGYDEGGHWRRPSNAMIDEYGINAFKSLARSHPTVFAEHHPDLCVLKDGRVIERPWAYEMQPLGMPR